MARLVECHKIKYGLNRCLEALGLAKSSYYWQQKKPTLAEKYEELRAEVVAVIAQHPAFGYRRIGAALRARGRVVNHKTLRRLLREWGLAMIRRTKKSSPSGVVRLLSELGGLVNLTLGVQGSRLFGLIRSDFTGDCLLPRQSLPGGGPGRPQPQGALMAGGRLGKQGAGR